ncbi:MAG: hypothetical protein AAGA58_09815 [Verrucomicrobiota bacterium]
MSRRKQEADNAKDRSQWRIKLPPPPEVSEEEERGYLGRAPKGDKALAAALEPVMRENIVRGLKENPAVIIDIVYPVLGRVVRKSISEAIRSLINSIEDSARSTFSLRRLKWRFQAMREGRPYTQILLENRLVYRVEEVMLIHRRTGLLAMHESMKPEHGEDRELVSGMLTAIEDFARDSFKLDDGANLSSFHFGDLQLIIKASPHALLAAAVRGAPPHSVHEVLDDALVTIHERCLNQLRNYDGDSSGLESIRHELRECLVMQEKLRKKDKEE